MSSVLSKGYPSPRRTGFSRGRLSEVKPSRAKFSVVRLTLRGMTQMSELQTRSGKKKGNRLELNIVLLSSRYMHPHLELIREFRSSTIRRDRMSPGYPEGETHTSFEPTGVLAQKPLLRTFAGVLGFIGLTPLGATGPVLYVHADTPAGLILLAQSSGGVSRPPGLSSTRGRLKIPLQELRFATA